MPAALAAVPVRQALSFWAVRFGVRGGVLAATFCAVRPARNAVRVKVPICRFSAWVQKLFIDRFRIPALWWPLKTFDAMQRGDGKHLQCTLCEF